jgi:hypothetical protein
MVVRISDVAIIIVLFVVALVIVHFLTPLIIIVIIVAGGYIFYRLYLSKRSQSGPLRP